MNTPKLPLEGIKVVELASVVAAPAASEMLCAYGAEVIKVEPLSGDPLRRSGAQLLAPSEPFKAPMFTLHNGGKNFISINLKEAKGMDIMKKLLEKADVFITNIRPASIRRLGLDYESLKQQYPRLIYAAFTGYGKNGPEANTPGYDSTAFWMRTGPVAEWVEKGAFPLKTAYGFGDVASSTIFLSGILMALIGREKTGLGTEVNTSLYQGGLWCGGNALIHSQFSDENCADPFKPTSMFSNYYLCSDGKWIGMITNDYPHDKDKIARLLGMEDIIGDPRYEDYESLRKSGVLKEAVLRCREIFSKKTSSQWMEFLEANDIACSYIYNTIDVIEDEQAIANNFIETVHFKDGVDVCLPAPPVKFSSYDYRKTEMTGDIGEHTQKVMEKLGYDENEVNKLRDENVVK